MSTLILPAPGTTRYADHPLVDGGHRYGFACQHGETQHDELRAHERTDAIRRLAAFHDARNGCDCASRRLVPV